MSTTSRSFTGRFVAEVFDVPLDLVRDDRAYDPDADIAPLGVPERDLVLTVFGIPASTVVRVESVPYTSARGRELYVLSAYDRDGLTHGAMVARVDGDAVLRYASVHGIPCKHADLEKV